MTITGSDHIVAAAMVGGGLYMGVRTYRDLKIVERNTTVMNDRLAELNNRRATQGTTDAEKKAYDPLDVPMCNKHRFAATAIGTLGGAAAGFIGSNLVVAVAGRVFGSK